MVTGSLAMILAVVFFAASNIAGQSSNVKIRSVVVFIIIFFT